MKNCIEESLDYVYLPYKLVIEVHDKLKEILPTLTEGQDKLEIQIPIKEGFHPSFRQLNDMVSEGMDVFPGCELEWESPDELSRYATDITVTKLTVKLSNKS